MVRSELAAACSSSDLAVVSGNCRRMCPQVGLGHFGGFNSLSFPIVLIYLPLHSVGVRVGRG